MYFVYQLGFVHTAPFHCVKSLWVLLDTKMYFSINVDNIIAQGLKMLGLIHYTKSSVSTIENRTILYVAVGLSKLEFDPLSWNHVAVRDSFKIEIIKRQFVALCYSIFLFTLALISTTIV